LLSQIVEIATAREELRRPVSGTRPPPPCCARLRGYPMPVQWAAAEASTVTTAEQPVPSLRAASARAALLVVGMGGADRSAGRRHRIDRAGGQRAASCPGLVVRGRRHPRGTNRPILIGVDNVMINAAALSFASADARRHDGPVVAISAI
jgi:hypothetical protein